MVNAGDTLTIKDEDTKNVTTTAATATGRPIFQWPRPRPNVSPTARARSILFFAPQLTWILLLSLFFGIWHGGWMVVVAVVSFIFLHLTLTRFIVTLYKTGTKDPKIVAQFVVPVVVSILPLCVAYGLMMGFWVPVVLAAVVVVNAVVTMTTIVIDRKKKIAVAANNMAGSNGAADAEANGAVAVDADLNTQTELTADDLKYSPHDIALQSVFQISFLAETVVLYLIQQKYLSIQGSLYAQAIPFEIMAVGFALLPLFFPAPRVNFLQK
ncbi:hypothetical protein HDU97_006578 [Phlyctochytrium planicorne]|nr:hypothetical protein HDU97_006578 [Phlyctochytrium planicorne]